MREGQREGREQESPILEMKLVTAKEQNKKIINCTCIKTEKNIVHVFTKKCISPTTSHALN